MTHAARVLQSHDLSGEGIKLWITYILFSPHKDMEFPPPRMSDEPNAGATSETAQTWKTIHTKHTLIHSNKANMKQWLWRPSDNRGPCGPKVSWHLSYRWGKTPNKPQPGILYRPGIESGPTADRLECYRLFHSGGHKNNNNNINSEVKFLTGVNGWNPEENLHRLRFVRHETNMEWPKREFGILAVGGERLTACTSEPPL